MISRSPLLRRRLPLRFDTLEERIAPAIITAQGRQFTDTEILVKVADANPLFALTGIVASQRLNHLIDIPASEFIYRRDTEYSGLVLAKLRPNVDPLGAAATLQAQPGVVAAEPNWVSVSSSEAFPTDPPNDTHYSKQWHLTKMKVDEAWKTTTGSSAVTVAVLDDGLPTTFEHEDLSTNRWKNSLEIEGDDLDQDFNGFNDDVWGWDFAGGDSNPSPVGAASHGTEVAGLIAATTNNGKGVSGVAGGNDTIGGARLMGVRIASGGTLTASNLIRGLHYAARNGAKIINVSQKIDPLLGASSIAVNYGNSTSSITFNSTVEDAFNYAYTDKKALIFVSAGNDNTGTAERAKLTQALFVANTTSTDARFADPVIGSNYGTWVDISAPGTAIVTTSTASGGTQSKYLTDTNQTTLNTGTSFAAPNAAGVAALIWSKFPSYSRDQVAAKLLGTADNIDAANPTQVGLLGTGRVNALRAVTETLPAPKFGTITGLPFEGGSTSALKTITFTAPWRFDAASVKAASFDLRGDGPDNLFGTVDDASVTLSVAPYHMGSNELSITVTGSLTPDTYRFTAKSGVGGLRNPFGVALDGNGDGTGGDAFTRTFLFSALAKIGNETRLNQYMNAAQENGSIALLPGGNTVVTWTSFDQDGQFGGIFARLVDQHGRFIGNEFQVNQFTADEQRVPVVAADAQGNFVIAWEGFGPSSTTYVNIWARRFSAIGTPLTGDIQVCTDLGKQQTGPAIDMEADGDFIITWNEGLSSATDVKFQRFFADGSKRGTEQKASTTTVDFREYADVAVNDNGTFVIVWSDHVSSDADIRGRRFDDAGAPLGAELTINALYTAGNQLVPSVETDAGGNFVVVWSSDTGDGSVSGVMARQFTKDGLALADEFVVNTTTSGLQQPERGRALAVAPSGDFTVVFFMETTLNNGQYDVAAQQFDVNGNKVGTEQIVNGYSPGNQLGGAVTMAASGDFTVVWQSLNPLGNGVDMYYQRYRRSTVVADVRPANDVNVIEQNERVVQPLNGLTVSFSGEAQNADTLANYVITVDGATTIPVTKVDLTKSAADNTSTIATLTLGSTITSGHVVLTAKSGATGILDAAGNPLDGNADGVFGGDFVRAWDVVTIGKVGSEFRVNTITEGYQAGATAVALPSGDYMVFWDSQNDVHGQRLDKNGNKVGDEFLVNTYTSDYQQSAQAAVDAGGDVVVVWESLNQDGSGYGVFGQRLDAQGNKIGLEFQVNSYTNGNQAAPTVAADKAGNFFVGWGGAAQDGSGLGAFGQFFTESGNSVVPVGYEFLVNNGFTDGNQSSIRSAADALGNYYVTWETDTYTSLQDVRVRRFGFNRTADSGELALPISPNDDQVNPFIACDNMGNVFVAFAAPDGSGFGSFLCGLNTDLSLRVAFGIVPVNQYTTGNQAPYTIAVDSDGGIAVVTNNFGQDGDAGGVYLRRFLASGAPNGNETRVNSFVVGEQYPGPSCLAFQSPDQFIIAWTSAQQDGDGYGIYAQRFGANTAPTTNGIPPDNRLEDFGSVSIPLAPHFADAEQDSTTLTYTVVGNSNAGLFTFASATATSLALVSAANASGVATITIRATDSAGLYFETPVVVTVVAVNDAPSFVKGPDVTVPINYSLQTYSGWATGLSTGGGNDEGSQALSFEIVSQSNPGLFESLEVLPSGTLRYDPTDEIYGSNIIQLRLRDSGGTTNSGVDVSPTQTVVLTVVPDYNFGYVRGQATANTHTTGAQVSPAVAVDADGDTVVVWSGPGPDDFDGGIYAQRFSNQGKLSGSAFKVNTVTTGDQFAPAVAMDRAGNFVVVWYKNTQGPTPAGYYFQRFSADGTAQGVETAVPTSTFAGTSLGCDVAFDAAGHFVITWNNGGQVLARRFSSDGTALGGEIPVAAGSLSSVAASADGRFVVSWMVNNGTSDVLWQRFDSSGVAVGSPAQAHLSAADNQWFADVAMSADGAFVLTWQAPDGDGDGVFARRYKADGTALDASEFSVNKTTTGNQHRPCVSIDADGDFAITWSGNGESDSTGVFVRRFAADGTAIDSKGLLANSITTGVQSSPAIAMDHDGEFVVAWAGETGVLSSSLVYTKLDDSGIAVQRFGYPLPPTQTKALEDYVGSEDADGNEYEYALFDYFSSATGSSEAMGYGLYDTNDPSQILVGIPTINTTTGRLRLIFMPGRPGEADVRIRVRDTTEVPIIAKIHVRRYALNDAPQLATIPPQLVNEGSTLTFTASGSDPADVFDLLNKNNTLTYSLIGAPVGASIDPATGKFTWTPPDNGSFTVTVRVTDNGQDDSLPGTITPHPLFADQTVTITVNNINPSATNFAGPGAVTAGQSATFTLSGVSDAPGDTPTLKYDFDWTADGTYDLLDQTTPSASHVFATPGVYTVRARMRDKDGGASEYTTQVTVNPPASPPPRIVSPSPVNNGAAQRSMVTSIVLAFDAVVTLPPTPSDAFVLSGPGGTIVPDVNHGGGSTTLTFGGGSLADGKYTLTVLGNLITAGGVALDGDDNGSAGGDYDHQFHRLFGDLNGDGFTDNVDFVQYRLANGSDSTMGNFNPSFDSNGDGFIDNIDFIAFRQRLGVQL